MRPFILSILILLVSCQNEPLLSIEQSIRVNTNNQPDYVIDTAKSAAYPYDNFLFIEEEGTVILITVEYPTLTEWKPGDIHVIGIINNPDPKFEDIILLEINRYFGIINETSSYGVMVSTPDL
jgi:hypothetical protein